MTIYNQITANKTKTFLIISLFIGFISFFFFLVGKFSGNSASYLVIGLLFSLFSGIGSYFYSDKIVLFMTGAKKASEKEHFDFYTVTENLSIAAGLPRPALYVINDPAPNAFATGRDAKHAVVVVTTGILQKLERAELEGVIAHELSHIKNYDILLMSIVSVLVGLVVFVSDWIMRGFWWGGFSRRDDREERGANALMFVFFILFLILTPIVATLIQLAISRRREFLADASAALITRYPEGLARALEKISNDHNILKTASNATAHLFIVNPFHKRQKFISWLAGLFSTHPPIGERIRILRDM